MATDPHIRHVEAMIGYTFKATHYLTQALTAAAVDENNYDGNRGMAQLGESLIGTAIIDNAVTAGATRDHRLTVAKRWGIETCVRFSPRQSGELPSPAVLSRAVSAIVGASWLDSGKDISVVTRVIERLGLDQPCIDPTILLLDPNNPHRADTVGPHTSSDDSQAANLFTKYVRSTEETPDAAVLLFDNDRSVEQRPRTAPAMGQAEALLNHTTQFGLLDYVDETRFGETQDIISSLEVATNAHTQSQDSSSILQEVQAVDSQHRERKTSNRQESSGRDSSLQEPVRLHPNETLLEQLIAHERRKFENQGRQDSFIFSLTQESISGLGAERHSWTLRVFFFAVASSHSMLTLRDILRACRDRTTGDLSEPMQGLSTAKRLEFIEHLEGNLAYFSLLRRCHILKLFMDNFDPSRQAEGGFIVQTQQSISNTGRKKSGNPSHVAHSEMTKSMIQEIYPELQPNTPGYQTKYRSVSELRKLGKRLHFLTTTFGYGILGLLPSTTGSDLCISDSMIQILPEDIFNKFVHILEKYQGDILRDFSDAVKPIVEGVFYGKMCRFTPLPIENIQQQQILEQPKGSAKLLELLKPEPSQCGVSYQRNDILQD
ncbi:hypothetical protein V2W45_1237018 [Cenococcum geophilum]